MLLAAASRPALGQASWGEVEIHRAYHLWTAPVFERLAAARPVAIDVGVELLPSLVELFFPGYFAISDAGWNDPGRPPILVIRLTAAGEIADPHDPIFADQPPHRMRLLVFGLVGRSAREVALRYQGDRVGPAAAIGSSGPVLPTTTNAPLAHAPAGRAPLDGYLRHRVLIEVKNWPRTSTPDLFQLSYWLTGREQQADADHWIEVDAAGQPIEPTLASLPLMVPVRRFVVEFWLPEGGRALALDHHVWGTPLPGRVLVLTPAALKALARAQPNFDAAHYRSE